MFYYSHLSQNFIHALRCLLKVKLRCGVFHHFKSLMCYAEHTTICFSQTILCFCITRGSIRHLKLKWIRVDICSVSTLCYNIFEVLIHKWSTIFFRNYCCWTLFMLLVKNINKYSGSHFYGRTYSSKWMNT